MNIMCYNLIKLFHSPKTVNVVHIIMVISGDPAGVIVSSSQKSRLNVISIIQGSENEPRLTMALTSFANRDKVDLTVNQFSFSVVLNIRNKYIKYAFFAEHFFCSIFDATRFPDDLFQTLFACTLSF